MSAENTTNTGAQEAENAEKYAVEVKNVTKIYRLYDKPIDRLKESLSVSHKEYHKDFYALSDLSFTVEKGQTVGIIGTNGSGKSTILKIITGVLTPTTGEVTVRGKISALLELGAGFNQDYTGIENIYMNGTMMGYTKKEMDAKLPEILDFAEIGDFVYQPHFVSKDDEYQKYKFMNILRPDGCLFPVQVLPPHGGDPKKRHDDHHGNPRYGKYHQILR